VVERKQPRDLGEGDVLDALGARDLDVHVAVGRVLGEGERDRALVAVEGRGEAQGLVGSGRVAGDRVPTADEGAGALEVEGPERGEPMGGGDSHGESMRPDTRHLLS
jgi:hypothetical protein